MRPRRRVETCREDKKLKEKEKATFYSPSDEWVLLAASTTKPEVREFVVDSASKMSDDGGHSQLRAANKRRGKSECQRIGFIRDSNASRRYTGSAFIGETLRRSRKQLPLDQWSETTSHQKWQDDQLQHSELRTLRCPWSVDKLFNLTFTYFSYIFIGGKRDSHGASSINRKWEYELRSTGNLLHGPAETENPNRNDDDEELHSDQLQGVPDWPQEFKHGPVDESVEEHRDASRSSHELASEPRAKVVSGKHSILTHFWKDRNCVMCLRTKITRVSCRERTGTVVSRAEILVI